MKYFLDNFIKLINLPVHIRLVKKALYTLGDKEVFGVSFHKSFYACYIGYIITSLLHGMAFMKTKTPLLI